MKAIIPLKKQANTNDSKVYAKYKRLLEAIETQQNFKSNLQKGLQQAYGKIENELKPLQKERNLHFRNYLIRLDELATEIGVGKFNREWFEPYMADEIASLLEFFGYQDKILSRLQEKYAAVSLDDIANDTETIELIESLSNLLGFEVDIREFLEKGETSYFNDHRDKILDHIRNNNDQFAEIESDQKKSGEKRSKKSKSDEDERHLANDARNVYMRLIKKFHPDLEKDPLLRDQKSEIVKQVTKAYQENDFFNLLKLQITYLEDNEKDAGAIADDMLKRYNKLLQKQLNELDTWVHEMHFTGGAIIADFIDKNGKFSPQKFAARRKGIEKESADLKIELASSKKRPKGWFKEQITIIKDSVQQNMMENIFADMFSDFKF